MRLPYAVTSFVISPRGEITSLRKWQDPEPEKSEQIFNAFSTTLKSVEELISTYEQTIGRGGQLMLGLAPDRRGLLSDADVKRLEEFGAAIRQRYAANLIAREHVPNAATDAAFDGDPDKFWSAPTGSHHAILETSFARPITFDHALTMEWLNDGQHIERYRIEVWTEGKWKTIVESHAIGHHWIDSFQAIKTSRIRLNILSSSAEAHVREFQVFNTGGATVSGTDASGPK